MERAISNLAVVDTAVAVKIFGMKPIFDCEGFE